ncbi:MAG: hypothetical protein ACXVIL_11715 [Halobacteriota archaeon]
MKAIQREIWSPRHGAFFDKETMRNIVHCANNSFERKPTLARQPSFRPEICGNSVNKWATFYSGISQRKLHTDPQRFGSRLGFFKHPLPENVYDAFMQSGRADTYEQVYSSFRIIHNLTINR